MIQTLSVLQALMLSLTITTSPLMSQNTLNNDLTSNEGEIITVFSRLLPSENGVNKATDALFPNTLNDATKEITPAKEHGQVINVETNLRLRKEPNLESEVIYGLFKGMIFDIQGKEGEWHYIKHNDTTGYVHESYIEEYEGTPPHEVYRPKPKVQIEQKPVTESSNIQSGQAPKGRAVKAELTAYCNDYECSEGWGGKTAMGTKTKKGVIAAPKTLKLGSTVSIPELSWYKSDGLFTVEDRGGAVKIKKDGTYIIDVWFPTHEETVKFGREKTTIYILE